MSESAALVAPLPIQTLDRRRVYILPTGAGLTLGVMDLVILLGATNYDNALGYLLAFLLGGLGIVAMLHTYRNLAGLRFGEVHAAPVFAGEDALFACQFAHDSRVPRLQLMLGQWPRRLSREARRVLARTQSACDLAARSTGVGLVRVPALRRGWLTLDRIRIQSVYPLGILRAWAYFDSPARVLVYPAPRGNLPLPRAPRGRDGARVTNAAGADEFAGLRPYVAGDPLRAIAWKSLAQERPLMVKRFHGHGAERLHLSWSAVAACGHPEARLAQLSKWVLDASRAGLDYTLELPVQDIPFGHGLAQRDRCLRTLALYAIEP